MTYAVQVLDETTAKPQPVGAMTLEFDSETLTLRELIRRRVYEECLEFNAGAKERFCGLVVPEGMEREFNSPVLRQGRRVDWEKQYAKALEAFERNRIIVLIGDRQAESLDEPVTLRLEEPLDVTFIKLVPLVGG